MFNSTITHSSLDLAIIAMHTLAHKVDTQPELMHEFHEACARVDRMKKALEAATYTR